MSAWRCYDPRIHDRRRHLMRQDNKGGSIKKGKRADIIVLDRNITSIPTHQISQTKVLLTLLEGEEVWRDPTF